MAIGKVIGRIAIKVLPDTTDFKEKTKNDLIKIASQLGELEVDVVPEVDKQARDKVKDELQRWARGLDLKAKLKLDLNNKDLTGIEAALDGVARKRSALIKPDLDTAALAKVSTALAALSGVRAVTGMFEKFREELLNLDQAVPTIGVVANSIGSLIGVAATAGGSILSLSDSLVQMSAAGLALPGLLGGVAIGLGVAAVALADFKTEVPQISKAWGDLRTAISENFWQVAGDGIRSLVDELFPTLASEASNTATVVGGFFGSLAESLQGRLLPAMSGMFDNLNKSVTIFTGHTDAIANIITILGDLGSKYLPSLATATGNVTQKFSDWLTAADEAGKLTAWVDNAVAQIEHLGRAIFATSSIFSTLAEASKEAGGATLGSVATALERVAAAAEAPAFKTGLVDTLTAAYGMMDQISSRVGPALGGLVKSLADTFQEMAPVMGDTVATAVSAIADALASPALQTGLKHLLSGFNRMVNELAPAMQPLADKLGAIGSIVGELAEAIGSILGEAIIAVSPLFVALAEALLPVIDGLGELVSGAVKDLAPVFSALAKTIREEVAPELPKLVEKLQELWDKIGPELIPILERLAENIGPLLVAAIETFTSALTTAIDIITAIEAVVAFFNDTTASLASAWDSAKESISGAVSAIASKLSETWNSIYTAAATKWTAIKADLIRKAAQIRSEVTTAVENLRTNLANKWESVRSNAVAKIEALRSGVSNAITNAKTAVLSRVEEIRSNLVGKWSSIATSASTGWANIKTKISDAIAQTKTAVVNKATEIVDYMRGLPGKIVSAVGDLGGLLVSAGKSLLSGLINGIDSKISEVKGKLQDLTAMLPDWKGPADRDAVLLKPAGQLIIEGLVDGLESRFSVVRSALTSLTDEVGSVMQKGVEDAMSFAVSDGFDASLKSRVTADYSTDFEALRRQVTSSARDNAKSSDSAKAGDTFTFGNITISLEDLKQLNDLQDFLDLLRVRTLQGEI